jgi:exosortase A-associated hydrolase 1
MNPAVIADERALTFDCEGDSLVGILSRCGSQADRGVLIVVGGPQYRVGSHRQFALLGRHLAEHGIPVLRFDYRGMGDSEGDARTFERVEKDICCAIDRFLAEVPGLKSVVLWGLCDAASAALLYAHRDARVSGLVLLNPWVHTEQGRARVQLRHYYLRRLFQPALWQKVARGEFKFREAAAALVRSIGGALGDGAAAPEVARVTGGKPLPVRMENALRRFEGKVLLILSGNDLVAQEFRSVVDRSSGWRRLLNDRRITRCDLSEANHTFARSDWRDQVARWTATWVNTG